MYLLTKVFDLGMSQDIVLKNGCLIWLIRSTQHMEKSFLRKNENWTSNGFFASIHETATCKAYIKHFDIVRLLRYFLSNRAAGTLLLQVLRSK